MTDVPERAFDDFTKGQVIELRPYPVTREEAIDFATQFDPQPLHLDDAAAADSMLGGLAVSGWHTSSMVMRMVCDSFNHTKASEGAPGLDQVRWLRPVRPGDTLSGTATILDTRPLKSRPGIGAVKLRLDVFNDAGEQVYMLSGSVFLRSREVGR